MSLPNFGNRFALFFPWGKGIGTFGIKVGNNYADITIMEGVLRLFTSVDENGKWGRFASTRRSWYKLTRKGWQLLKREDFWGEWQNGKRRPPLYELPEQGIPQRAWELREYFQPWKIIEDWYGQRVEVISFPSPENHKVTVMMRMMPGDPTSMVEVVLEDYLPECGPNS